jgi:hypothetical protein
MFCPLKQVSARYSPRAVAAEVSFVRVLVELHTCAQAMHQLAQHSMLLFASDLALSAAGASKQVPQAHSFSFVC